MSAPTIRPPNSVHEQFKELAERDQISVNPFIASAATEKLASVLTLDYLKAEAALGDRAALDRFLSTVPDSPVAEGNAAVVELLGTRHDLSPRRTTS